MLEALSIIMYLLCMVIFPIYLGVMTILQQRRTSACVNATCCGNYEYIIKCVKCYMPEFVYTINGKTYNSRSSQIMNKPYHEDTCYKIYVNPTMPSEFVLEKGIPIGGYIIVGIGFIFFVLFLFSEM